MTCLILSTEKRDASRNAKQITKAGLIPGCVYGRDLDSSLILQLHENDVKHSLKAKSKGNIMTLCLKEMKYNVIIKEIGRNPVGKQIEHISFHNLVNDEMVSSTARIVLLNKEKVSNSIQQRYYEIPYKARPSNMLEVAVY